MARLTPGQRRALLLLRGYADTFGPTSYTKPGRAQDRTLDALARLGYAETQEWPMCTVARITPAGRAYLNA